MQMVDGVWRAEGNFSHDAAGRFVRADAQFRDWVTADGAPGPSGEGGFKAEPGRYRLYVSLACPWAHRTLIFRKLKGLERIVDLSVVNWLLGEEGWTFAPGRGVVADPVLGAEKLYELYLASRPGYSGRCTVPVLFDTQRRRIVNNESSEIIRMFNSAFDGVGAKAGDFYPAELREEIDALNARIYPTVNNGVYRCGFARSQQAYDEAVAALFDSLDWTRGAARRSPLPLRRARDRSRLAPVHDAGALRSGLCRPVQVQCAPHRRLSQPQPLSRGPARLAGRRGDDRLFPHQASLLREPEVH